jgi:hypothetical protein
VIAAAAIDVIGAADRRRSVAGSVDSSADAVRILG